MYFHSIKEIYSKKLIGIKLDMSLAQDYTFELWSEFMPRIKEIEGRVSSELFSVQVINSTISFSNFTPSTQFEKWATVEVANFSSILPKYMDSIVLSGGSYAVFINTTHDNSFIEYIFEDWLPQSNFILDTHRYQFAVMGEKYKLNSLDSEEEIWVPIKQKIKPVIKIN